MALDEKLLERDPDRVARMFTEISPRYDLLNRILSMGLDRRWRRTAVRMARPKGARRILDLASGTGDLSFEFLKDSAFEGEVLGLDFSQEMVRRARKKAAARRVSNRVQFRSGDALDIPEPDGYFDLVSVALASGISKIWRRGCSRRTASWPPAGDSWYWSSFGRRRTR